MKREFSAKESERVFKIVVLFLMKYLSGDISDHDWEVSEAKWVTPSEALDILSFSTDKDLLKKADLVRATSSKTSSDEGGEGGI